MKIIVWIMVFVAAGIMNLQAQHASCSNPNCDGSCGHGTATALSFAEPVAHTEEEHTEQEDHSDHDHADKADGDLAECDHGECDHGEETEEDHSGHDHAAAAEVEDHSGHDHDAHAGCAHDAEGGEGGLEVPEAVAEKIGLHVRIAAGGEIHSETILPAEIKLNRDRMAAVSARYASIVKAVYAEIGDSVEKGDVLLSLENRETMANYSVQSPLSGVIISKNVTVGESAGEDRILLEVADLSTVWADISIFPQYQHLIKKGMPVEFIAHDGHTAKGKIQYISPLVSHETRTFTARCILSGADEDFTPGVFVRARMGTESESVAVRVEQGAVQTVEGNTIVFVPEGDVFKARDVKLGHKGAGFIEIVAGLQAGEAYVAAGAFALKAEMVTSGMDPHAGHGH